MGTADDFILTSGVISYRDPLNAGVITFPAPLPIGIYQVVATTNITDLANNSLKTTLRSMLAVLSTLPTVPL